MLFIEKKTRSVGSLAPDCVIFNLFRTLDVKCSNSSNHRRLVSVKVPRIRDVSLLCYRFQSERITETAKWSNVVNYLDSILSRPGFLKPNRDILASRRQRSGFRDIVSKTETVPEKQGRLVNLPKPLVLTRVPLLSQLQFPIKMVWNTHNNTNSTDIRHFWEHLGWRL